MAKAVLTTRQAWAAFLTADTDSSNTYIVWALLESGEPVDSLKNELEKVKTVAFKSDDSYVIALGANVSIWVARKSR
ncbi:MAG: hypothetical protein R3C24_02570 [Cyanobacteriota/Melainabacteria group bacterium]